VGDITAVPSAWLIAFTGKNGRLHRPFVLDFYFHTVTMLASNRGDPGLNPGHWDRVFSKYLGSRLRNIPSVSFAHHSPPFKCAVDTSSQHVIKTSVLGWSFITDLVLCSPQS